jgi:hypothetical protein
MFERGYRANVRGMENLSKVLIACSFFQPEAPIDEVRNTSHV